MRILGLRGRTGLVWLASLLSLPAFAASTPSFNNVSDSDFAAITKELSGNFAYSSATPASSLGGLWGFELGLVGGITKTPQITALVQKSDPTFNQTKFPHAGALIRIGAPVGLTAEAMILPKINASDLSLSQYGGAVMWTVTDVYWKKLPLNLAVKGYFNKTQLSYKSTFTNTNAPPGTTASGTITYDGSSYGLQLLASRKFSVFTPYVGIGFANAKGEITIDSSVSNASFFDSGRQNALSKPSSAQLLAGLDIKLFFLALGAEYQRAFGTNSLTGRVSFRF